MTVVEKWTPRKRAAANTYYVRKDGLDTNDGLADTAGGAFLTIQHALNVVANKTDLGGENTTIQARAGTYAENLGLSSPWVGSGSVTLLGDTTTPSNVVIAPASGAGISTLYGAVLNVGGFKITTTNSYGLFSFVYGVINIVGKMDFGDCGSGYHIFADVGAVIGTVAYTISGNAAAHWWSNDGGIISIDFTTVTLTGSPVFSVGFAKSSEHGRVVCVSTNFSGSAGSNSKRYALTTGGSINTGGVSTASTTFFPGDTAGTVDASSHIDGYVDVALQPFRKSVDFNAGSTDTPFTISLPPGITRYLVNSVRISGASASITTATAGLFTAASGSGVAIVTAASALTVSTDSENTNGNSQNMTINNAGTQSFNAATLYWRVADPQGSAATATVEIVITPLS